MVPPFSPSSWVEAKAGPAGEGAGARVLLLQEQDNEPKTEIETERHMRANTCLDLLCKSLVASTGTVQSHSGVGL